MKNIPFQIYSLGCKVSQYDAASLAASLEEAGFSRGSDPRLVIINTCSVTKNAVVKDRQFFRRLKKDFPEAECFVIMGCWPQVARQAAESVADSQTIIWGTGELELLSEQIKKRFSLKDLKTTAPSACLRRLAKTERSRYFLKIADGCNQYCSYCLIPYARGPLASRPSAEVIAEVNAALIAGYQEIVLTAIHLGRYGFDRMGEELDLVALLKAILAIPGDYRLRLSSIEVTEVSEDLLELMKNDKRICRHLHVSLQSASDKVLSLMRRPYTRAYFRERIEAYRNVLPDLALTTDVIVGFPGETALDFQETLSFCESLSFSKIHVFPFSEHESLPAASLPDKVPLNEIKKRAASLRSLSRRLEEAYRQKIIDSYRGGEILVLVEHPRQHSWEALTEYSFSLSLDKDKMKYLAMPGKLFRLTL
jgi:threonylcarbamoyladenosine tRNA methylthiotransferase MtaB